MATVEQIKAYIIKLKKTVTRLNSLNKELKQQVEATKEFSVDRVLELECDLEEMEAKVDRLAAHNERLGAELESLKQQEPKRNKVAVLHCNDWKMTARC